MKLNPIRANMTELELNGATILFSYKTPVAYNGPLGKFKTDKKWSVTTSRHINEFGAKDYPTRPQTFFDNMVQS